MGRVELSKKMEQESNSTSELCPTGHRKTTGATTTCSLSQRVHNMVLQRQLENRWLTLHKHFRILEGPIWTLTCAALHFPNADAFNNPGKRAPTIIRTFWTAGSTSLNNNHGGVAHAEKSAHIPSANSSVCPRQRHDINIKSEPAAGPTRSVPHRDVCDPRRGQRGKVPA